MKHRQFVLASLFAASIVVYWPGNANAGSQDTNVTAAQEMSAGEVRRVDKDAGKLTIKHGPLANLNMPAMTMVFRVKDPAMLDQVKAGDKIRFVADNVNGALTVTKIDLRRE